MKRSYLGHRIVLIVCLALAPLAWSTARAEEPRGDDGSKIVITSPAEGAVVNGESVDLKYELTKGGKAHHAHVYLDGQYQKGFKGTFTNLPAGRHEIKVVAATDDHKGLAAESAVTIEVKY
ncbi:MAG: hypothetical protein KF814_17980 [Nitrospiraceae bacterium]|nr:hypothetical protein [Nitrospiraceae bacterium]